MDCVFEYRISEGFAYRNCPYLSPPQRNCSCLGNVSQCWACSTQSGPGHLAAVSVSQAWLDLQSPSPPGSPLSAPWPGRGRRGSPGPAWTPHQSGGLLCPTGTGKIQSFVFSAPHSRSRSRAESERILPRGTEGQWEQPPHGIMRSGLLKKREWRQV